jgi:hypothetical protein
VSGLLKNPLDHVEDQAQDPHSYFDGRAVALMVGGSGWQLTAMRVAINALKKTFDQHGSAIEETAARQIAIPVNQLVDFARMRCGAAEEVA